MEQSYINARTINCVDVMISSTTLLRIWLMTVLCCDLKILASGQTFCENECFKQCDFIKQLFAYFHKLQQLKVPVYARISITSNLNLRSHY